MREPSQERGMIVGLTGMGKVQASIESVARTAPQGATIQVFCSAEYFPAYKERLLKRRPDIKLVYADTKPKRREEA